MLHVVVDLSHVGMDVREEVEVDLWWDRDRIGLGFLFIVDCGWGICF